MRKPSRVALVGIGGYGAVYVNALLTEGAEHNVHFEAAIDPIPQVSRVYEQVVQAGVPVYPDLDHFFAQDRGQGSADLVVISAPIHLHLPMTRQVLEAGVDVLCEKPLAGSLEDGYLMQAAQRESGRVVAIGYQWSYSTAVQALKQDVQSGILGKPKRLKTLVLWPRRISYFQRNNWAGRVRMPDGAWVHDSPVNNATAHYLHNMLYILGAGLDASVQVDRLQAELYRANDIENYDAAAIRLWTDGGVEILFYTAHPVAEEVGPLMEYEFENGTVTFNALEDPQFVAHFTDGSTKIYGNPNVDYNLKLWQAAAAQGDSTHIACGIQASLSHLQCVEAAQRSMTDITTFLPEHVRDEAIGDDRLVWVPELGPGFQEAFQHGALPTDLGMGWAAAGQVVKVRRA